MLLVSQVFVKCGYISINYDKISLEEAARNNRRRHFTPLWWIDASDSNKKGAVFKSNHDYIQSQYPNVILTYKA